MIAPNGVRVESACYALTAGTAGAPTRSPRLRDGAWLLLKSPRPHGFLLGQVEANWDDPAVTLAALTEAAAGLPGEFAFDVNDLVPDVPGPSRSAFAAAA